MMCSLTATQHGAVVILRPDESGGQEGSVVLGPMAVKEAWP